MAEYVISDADIAHLALGVSRSRLSLKPVLRCRDCVHWREVAMADGTREHRCDGAFAFVRPNPDGFCAWGKEALR